MTIPPNMDSALREQVFVSRVGEVPTVPADSIDSFFLEVHRCCVRWIGMYPSDTASPCVFVLSERLDIDPVYEQHADKFHPSVRLDTDQLPAVLGTIVLTSGNLRLAFSICDPSNKRVHEIVQTLQDMSLTDRP